MPQVRERHRAREVSRDDEQYIILVQDIPRHCRWQELKDMTRSLGSQQSLKAEVFEVPNGNGIQMGHCTIKGKSNAVKVYDNLCTRGWNGHRVRVQLSAQEKNGSLRTVEGPVQTNGPNDSARAPNLAYPGLQGPTVTSHPASHPVYVTSAPAPASLPYHPQYATMGGWSSQPVVPSPTAMRAPPSTFPPSAFPSQQPYLPLAQAQTMAPATQCGTNYLGTVPVSPTSAVAVRSVNDGTTIFLSGLPYYQSENDLRRLLNQYGHIIYLEIHPDSRNPGKNKGTARARYSSASDVLRAVRQLDGKYLKDRKISVKQERDDPTRSSISAPPRTPLFEARHSHSNSSKQSRSVAFSSGTKAQRLQESSRSKNRSRGSNSPAGPLVVNGARTPSARRGSRVATSESDSDESSDDSESENTSNSASDNNEDRDVRKVTSKLQRHRL